MTAAMMAAARKYIAAMWGDPGWQWYLFIRKKELELRDGEREREQVIAMGNIQVLQDPVIPDTYCTFEISIIWNQQISFFA